MGIISRPGSFNVHGETFPFVKAFLNIAVSFAGVDIYWEGLIYFSPGGVKGSPFVSGYSRFEGDSSPFNLGAVYSI